MSTATFGARRRRTFNMSRIAAPLGEVTMPMRFGNFGSARLRAESNSPSASSLRFSASNFAWSKPGAARLQDLDAELVLAARFEDGNVAVNLDLRAIGKRRVARRQRVAKDHAGDRGPLIFQGEILMAGRMQFVVRDFSLHPDRAEFCFERSANLPRQFGDGEDLRRVWKKSLSCM